MMARTPNVRAPACDRQEKPRAEITGWVDGEARVVPECDAEAHNAAASQRGYCGTRHTVVSGIQNRTQETKQHACADHLEHSTTAE